MQKDEIRERLVELILSVPPFAIIPTRACGKATTQNSMVWANHIAKRLIANGVTIQEWIPVSERLPDEEGEVLLYDTEYEGICMGEYCKGNKIIEAYWFVGGHAFPVAEYTHWMPLPMPPKED